MDFRDQLSKVAKDLGKEDPLVRLKQQLSAEDAETLERFVTKYNFSRDGQYLWCRSILSHKGAKGIEPLNDSEEKQLGEMLDSMKF